MSKDSAAFRKGMIMVGTIIGLAVVIILLARYIG
tara:strand:+ start:237 stop:338 length:102 start_codon:yes stop_codon:yes gene_type:complete